MLPMFMLGRSLKPSTVGYLLKIDYDDIPVLLMSPSP